MCNVVFHSWRTRYPGDPDCTWVSSLPRNFPPAPLRRRSAKACLDGTCNQQQQKQPPIKPVSFSWLCALLNPVTPPNQALVERIAPCWPRGWPPGGRSASACSGGWCLGAPRACSGRRGFPAPGGDETGATKTPPPWTLPFRLRRRALPGRQPWVGSWDRHGASWKWRGRGRSARCGRYGR